MLQAKRKCDELPELTEFERQVYERQIQLPDFGEDGQRVLKASSVMISRVGGLGGTVAMLLARAGIGRLVLAHDGVVEHENLNRMHLAMREDLGTPRIEAFLASLNRINPDVDVITDGDNVTADNVGRLTRQADMIVDGAPLFEERYLMNQEAVKQRKPLVMAAMFGMEGYVTTIFPGDTPCLRCIYPEAPDYWNLRVFPVMAPSSVWVATMAAMETIKVLTGYGETLANQLLYCDLASNTFRRLRIERRPGCPVCGDL